VDEEKAKKLGLAAFVMKPINLSEIDQTRRTMLLNTRQIEQAFGKERIILLGDHNCFKG